MIVGVGDADFSEMEFLDSDDKVLTDAEGKKAVRDIVQFVPMNKFRNIAALRKATLAEVPQQLTSYMKLHGIEPRPLPI